MFKMKWVGVLAIAGFLAGCGESENSGASSGDQDTSVETGYSDTNGAGYAPDNTGMNERDRSDSALTSGDQGGSDADRETTRRIRRALTSNDQLSTDAKNIKIITREGKVTLRGPVNSQQELDLIKSVVQQMGVTSVDNQLQVKPRNQ